MVIDHSRERPHETIRKKELTGYINIPDEHRQIGGFPRQMTHAFAPQYYYSTDFDGQFVPTYQDYDFLGNPMGGEPPENISVISAPPGAGMAAASSSNGYDSPPATEHMVQGHEQHPIPGTHPSRLLQPNQQGAAARAYYHSAPPTAPPTNEPYPVVTQQSGPIRVTARHPSATASQVLVDTDADGTVWIKFEYTRNRVKWLYRVRCDVEQVNEDEYLTEEFKHDNCIYPRAMVPAEEYTGHRQKYETECNHLGWRLAWLNPDLRNRRGLIQRAVDSYRNSSGDVSVRSRRVRRLAKQQVTPRR